MSSLYIFGYGSLLNPRSRAKTFAAEDVIEDAVLNGYQRKINAPYNGYLYLNVIPNEQFSVAGVLVKVPLKDFDALKKREIGYECVNVTDRVDAQCEEEVFAFMAPDVPYPGFLIPQTYVDTCLAGVPEAQRESWLLETIIENPVENDRLQPKYEFVDKG